MNIKDFVLEELGAVPWEPRDFLFTNTHGRIPIDSLRERNGRYFLNTFKDEHKIVVSELVTHGENDDEDQPGSYSVIKFTRDDESVTIKFVYNLDSYAQAEDIEYQIVKPVEVTTIKWVSVS